jgi:hypothetical protein
VQVLGDDLVERHGAGLSTMRTVGGSTRLSQATPPLGGSFVGLRGKE